VVIYLRGPSLTPMRVPSPARSLRKRLHRAQRLGVAMFSRSRQTASGSHISPTGGSDREPQFSLCIATKSPKGNRLRWRCHLVPVRLAGVGRRTRWAPGGEAIDYVLTRNGVSNIWRQKLAGGSPKQITNFESGQIFDFDWSHDGRQLALTRGIESSDVILINNFR
jgi:hypothetical protein